MKRQLEGCVREIKFDMLDREWHSLDIEEMQVEGGNEKVKKDTCTTSKVQ